MGHGNFCSIPPHAKALGIPLGKLLKSLMESQNGRCPYTGWKLLLPDTSDGWKDAITPQCASLDRIDNSKGYVQGNFQFVSVMANYAKNVFTDQQLREFCVAVANNKLL